MVSERHELRSGCRDFRSSAIVVSVLILSSVLAIACASGNGDASRTVPTYGYEIVERFPHDERAFTQGLVMHEGRLFEGTGQEGFSTVREVELESGRVLRRVPIEKEYFGEGITILGDRVYQLTWRAQKAFVYDVRTFKRVGQFSYPGEGWGLTHDGERLIMSDGTDVIRYLDPASFKEIGRVSVKDGGRRVSRLNELEFIDGEIWANVWETDLIVRIDPESGQVNSWIDLANLLGVARIPGDRVLNGIAWDAAEERLLVTGKNWPYLFHIRLTD